MKRKKERKEREVAQSCLTLYDPIDCSLPGTSVHGIFQARVLEWVVISFSRGSSQPRDQTQARILEWAAFPFRGSSQPRDQTQVSCIAGRFFVSWATREAWTPWSYLPNMHPSVHIHLPGERIIIFSKNVYDLQERLKTATHRSLRETII